MLKSEISEGRALYVHILSQRKQGLTAFIFSLCLAFTTSSCRTAGEPDPEVKTPVALTQIDTSKSPILKRAIGAVTQKYPENRVETCVIVEGDVSNLKEVETAIATLKGQTLGEGFIFRPQIPSIQYFGFQGSEAVLISETNDEKMKYRQPTGELGNHALDVVMAVFDAKCGARNVAP